MKKCFVLFFVIALFIKVDSYLWAQESKPEDKQPVEKKHPALTFWNQRLPEIKFEGEQAVLKARQGADLLFLKVRINGRGPFFFLVDTGYNVNAIDPRLAAELELPLLPGSERHVYVDNMKIGPVTLGRHWLPFHDMSVFERQFGRKISGIIGGALFSQLPFSVSHYPPRIVLYKRQNFKTPSSEVIPLHEVLLPDVQLVNDKPFIKWRDHLLLIDTGDNDSLYVPTSFYQQFKDDFGVMTGRNQTSELVKTASGEETTITSRHLLNKVRLFGESYEKIFAKTISGGQKDYCILGNALSNEYELTFDYQEKKMWAQFKASAWERQLKAQNINCQDFLNRRPLDRAVRTGHFGRVKALLAAGADIDAQDPLGISPLIRALIHQYNPIALHLIKQGADLEIRSQSGASALSLAVIGRNVAVLEELIRHGVDLNARYPQGVTPIFWPVQLKHPKMVKFLIEHGAQTDVQLDDGTTLRAFADLHGVGDLIPVGSETE